MPALAGSCQSRSDQNDSDKAERINELIQQTAVHGRHGTKDTFGHCFKLCFKWQFYLEMLSMIASTNRKSIEIDKSGL